MPVTANAPGFWYDKSLEALDVLAQMAQAGRNAGMKADAMLETRKYPMQPGQIDPSVVSGLGVAPLNDPNKGQKDAEWLAKMFDLLDRKQGATFNVRGEKRVK